MSATIGDVLVLAALLFSAAGVVVGIAAGRTGSPEGLRWTRRLAYAFGAAMASATLWMVIALVRHDFSVRYVAKVGSTTTPLYITIVSLWSSLEGSILFWGFILGVYAAVFTLRTRTRNVEAVPYALAVTMLVGAFFSVLLAGPANPFSPSPSPVPTDGPGPNPLLQNHVLMIVHPPMLYLGYVGMTLPFGVAVAALVRGQLGPAWLQLLRSTLLVPWTFLTIGITLGGWWAYEVLGWGGYWAWDPVENASFMPWLTATAAIHALMMPQRRGSLKGWTVTLVLATFLLTLLGTFMTRSGVFNSVHSFSQSEIGPVFLGFIAVSLVGCVLLLGARIDALEGEGAPTAPVSRETAFLANNLLFTALTFTILVGTTFPLVVEAIQGKKLSVGEPYFNRIAVPTGVGILFLMGIGPALPWGNASAARLRAALLPPGGAALAAVALAMAIGVRTPWPLAAAAGAGFAAWVTGRELVLPVRTRMREHGEALGLALRRAVTRGRRRYGGYVVHVGMIAMITAIAMSSAFKVDREVVLKKGETFEWQGYAVTYSGVKKDRQPNRSSTIATLDVRAPDGAQFTLEPALNHYSMSAQPIGSPAVHSTPRADFYASLMNMEDGGASAGIHLFLSPLVAWIWAGAGIAAIGAVMGMWPARRVAVAAAVAEAAK